MGIVRNCAHMNSFILRTGLWSRSDHELWFVFLWNPSVKQLSVKTPSCSMPSVGTSFVNNTLLFLLNTLVLTSENMLCKSSLSPLGELVEARVVTGSAANGTDFLESMVSRLSKGHFDLHFLDLNWKSPASLRLELSLKNSSLSSKFLGSSSQLCGWIYLILVPPKGWDTFTPKI